MAKMSVKVRQPVQLVKIEKDRTAFFKGKELVIAVGEGLEKDQLEFYRTNHEQLKIDAGAIIKEIKMVEVPEDRLEELLEGFLFLNEHVLRGSTREEWLNKSAEDILA